MRRRGFTYVELGLVIVVVGVCASLVVPNLSRWQRGRQERIFESRLVALANEARAQAAESGNVVALGYDKAERAVQAIQEADSKPKVLRSVDLPMQVEANRFSADRNESPTDGWRVPFFPDGACAGGGIEFRSSTRFFHLALPRGNRRPLIGEGALRDLSEESWQAGFYEKR